MSKNNDVFNLHNRDVREFQTVLAEYGYNKEFVDVTVTSPPYHDIKSYDSDNQIGYGQKYPQYLDDLGQLFGDIYKVTRDTGSLWIIVDTFTKQGKLVNLPWALSQEIMKHKWNLTDVIIWKKDKALPWSAKGQLRSIFEYVLLFTKTKHYKFYTDRIRIADFSELKEWWVKYPERYNPEGKLPTNLWEFYDREGDNPNDVWLHPIPVQGSWSHRSLRHFNPLPPSMIERILLLTTDPDDVVLDPFAGSGVVLAVAGFMNRRWLGFELNVDYNRMFKNHTLDEIQHEMTSRKKRDNEVRESRERFKEVMKNLRLVKFPKILAHKILSGRNMKEGNNPVNTIFALSHKQDNLLALPKNKLWTEQVFLVFENNIEEEVLHARIRKAISTPPLSKFGIEPEVQITNRKEFTLRHEKEFREIEFWLYLRGIVHKFERSMTFTQWLNKNESNEWMNYAKEGVPPILSNIKVNEEVPRTWISKKDRIKMLKDWYTDMISLESSLE